MTLFPLARRAQAEHNIMFESNRPTEGRKLLDPALSALGRDQAAALCQDPLVLENLEGYALFARKRT